jgi:cytochrome c-type biogenesis protein CcmH/NrfG
MGILKQHRLVEEAAPQLYPHYSVDMGKVERVSDARPAEPNTTRIQRLVEALQQQLAQQPAADDVSRVLGPR